MVSTPRTRLLSAVVACVVTCVGAAAVPVAAQSGVTIEASPVPGQLDVLQGTAIKLGGKVEAEASAASYAWTIVQGEGGKLYDADKATAIFLAPAIETDLELFIVQCSVAFPGQDEATAILTVRVHRKPPADASAPDTKKNAKDSESAWLEEIYSQPPQTAGLSQAQRNQIVSVTSHRHYPPWGFGFGWGWGWGGFIDYPVYVPIVISGPGVDIGPGDGSWVEPVPIPYDQLITTFPEAIAGNYLPQDYPFTGVDLPHANMPVDAFDLPYLPADTYDDPMIDPGFAVDDFGW